MNRIVVSVLLSVFLSPSVSAQIKVEDPHLFDLASKGILNPQGITSNPRTKSFYLVSKSQVVEITSEGSVLSSFSILKLTNKAEGIAYDPVTEKLLIVSGSERIYAVNSDGSDISRRPYLILQGPRVSNGVAVDPATKHIWIADKDAELLVEYDRSGQQLDRVRTTRFLSSFDEPLGWHSLATICWWPTTAKVPGRCILSPSPECWINLSWLGGTINLKTRKGWPFPKMGLFAW